MILQYAHFLLMLSCLYQHATFHALKLRGLAKKYSGTDSVENVLLCAILAVMYVHRSDCLFEYCINGEALVAFRQQLCD